MQDFPHTIINLTVAGKKRRAVTQAEIDELAADVALIKKLKNRKISKEQFDQAFDG